MLFHDRNNGCKATDAQSKAVINLILTKLLSLNNPSNLLEVENQ